MKKELRLEFLLEQLNAYLGQQGLQKSLTRVRILEALCSELLREKPFFDVEDVFVYMASIRQPVSRATIYTTLDHFCQAGILFRMARSVGAIFLFSYKCKGHILLFCAECGKLSFRKETLSKEVERLTLRGGRKIQNYLVTMCVCSECCKRQKARERNKQKKKNKI